MKIKVLQENFYKTLSMVGRCVDSRAALPILSNVLLQAKDGRLKMTGTNTEMTTEAYCGVEILEEGEITIPDKILTEVVASMKTEKMEIAVEPGKTNIKIIAGKFTAEIMGQGVEEWPKMEIGDWKLGVGTETEIEKEIFEEIVNKVTFSAATDESRPQLTGVLFNTTEEGVDIVATDGYRLAKFKTQNSKFPAFANATAGKQKQQYLIPAKATTEAAKIWGEEKAVKMILTGNGVKFVFDDATLTTRLLEGKYPEYQKVVPESTANKVTVLKEDLLEGVRAAGIMARDSANIIKIKTSPFAKASGDRQNSKLKITANTPQVGSQEVDIDIVKQEGEDWEIAFNYRFVLDFLVASKAEKIIIGVNEADKPAVFMEEGADNYLYVVMPVRVQQ